MSAVKLNAWKMIVGPGRESLPVLARRAQQSANDRDGIRARDVRDDVAAASIGDPVDEVFQHADHGVVQARHRSRRERLGAQPAQAAMLIALQTQQAGDHLVPQRARGDALRLQHDALRYLEPLVAQHGPDHLIGEHLGPERADRDGRLLLCRAQTRIDLRRVLIGAVVQRRQIGIGKSRMRRY